MWQGAGRLVADRYALEAVLHGRGLGVVCRARDLTDDRPVALKQLRPPEWLPATELPSLAARIRREVAVAATVEHPALAAVYDLVDDGGQPVLVMELVDGVTLHELVRRHGPLPPRRSAQLAAEVLAGLAAMHQAGVLHGAVSPGTLLVTPAGAAGAAPELAGWLGSVVARLLAADPAGRPSAGDAARLLVETAPASVPLRLPEAPTAAAHPPVEQPALVPTRAPVAASAPALPSPAAPAPPTDGAARIAATTRFGATPPDMAPTRVEQQPWPSQGDPEATGAAPTPLEQPGTGVAHPGGGGTWSQGDPYAPRPGRAGDDHDRPRDA